MLVMSVRSHIGNAKSPLPAKPCTPAVYCSPCPKSLLQSIPLGQRQPCCFIIRLHGQIGNMPRCALQSNTAWSSQLTPTCYPHQNVFVLQIRNIGYEMRDTLDPYGIQLGFAFNAVSALRGQVSASADAANNNADQGITINGVSLPI